MERRLLSAAAPPAERLRRAVVLRRALRHGRGELDVLRPAARRGLPRSGPSARRRTSSSPSSCIRSSRIRAMFKERLRERPADGDAAATTRPRRSTRWPRAQRRRSRRVPRAASNRWPSAGKLGALLAQFPPSFKDAPASRDYLADLLRALRRLSGRRRAAASQLERSRSARRWRC